MATLSTLVARVGKFCARSSESNFADIVEVAIDEFLDLACRQFDFKKMLSWGDVTLASGSYQATFPVLSKSGLSTTPYHIIGGAVASSSGGESRLPVILRPKEWLNKKFSDRARTGSNSSRPCFAAVVEDGKLDFQAPADEDYTVRLFCSSLPLASASWPTAGNPLPELDTACVQYALHTIYQNLEAYTSSDRAYQKAWAIWNMVKLNEPDPYVLFQADVRWENPQDSRLLFNPSDLAAVYGS